MTEFDARIPEVYFTTKVLYLYDHFSQVPTILQSKYCYQEVFHPQILN